MNPTRRLHPSNYLEGILNPTYNVELPPLRYFMLWTGDELVRGVVDNDPFATGTPTQPDTRYVLKQKKCLHWSGAYCAFRDFKKKHTITLEII